MSKKHLVNVNLREGWQIISDILHRFNKSTFGQTQKYNPYHAVTRQFSTQDTFLELCFHYRACCDEYMKRTQQKLAWITYFEQMDFVEIATDLPTSSEEEAQEFYENQKLSQLSHEERLTYFAAVKGEKK